MKYVNFLFIAKLFLIITYVLLSACGGNTKATKVQTNVLKDVLPDMVSTQEFLPHPKVDKAGAAIPYEPMPNPYSLQKGKIKKESVATFIEAKRALKLKQYAQAEKLLIALTKDDKELSGPWVLLGDLAAEQKQYDDAISHYNQAIQLNKVNVNAYMHLALVQRQKGDFLQAQNTYAKLLTVWPDSPEAHLNLAVLYDIYLNHPLRAQKHMEAYQFLTAGENKEVATWLAEVRQRTGVAASLDVNPPKAVSKPLGEK